MKKSDFYFDLPPELIAQTPIPERDHSRLLCMDKATGELSHMHFYDLPSLLRPGDCLVVNDSRVLPARLIGQRPSGGAAELVLLKELGNDCWECLCRPGKRLREGAEVLFGDRKLTAVIEEILPGGNRKIRFR
ncbi:MAG: S-adenosylmethionine:tRNA ribosyltransferase-isomerase, partial [Lachnospiraceae bacterium]|nr:S-adenosylmethionine:tRNA ribosyltransferase-isomerase [Lachnospiraceae bacterium]